MEASVAAAAAAVRSQWDDGRAVLEFRCETPEVYAGMRSLLFDRDRLCDRVKNSAAAGQAAALCVYCYLLSLSAFMLR